MQRYITRRLDRANSMYAAIRTKLLVCCLLLTGCASAPAHHNTVAGMSTGAADASVRDTHQNVVANMVAIVTAMGGNNPTLAYRAMTTRGCIHPHLLTGPQPLDTRPSTQILKTATVTAPSPCPRLAAVR